ncbi:hypothetical protein HJG60_008857 [Phyllostomus discolor]|uniref:Uncharacterized protein n=1 Tax=Phyllostomus discolor TaxID=89673 RepID=A0A834DJ03_9CHIR|nr:hypothetical protein HJG60_008857 [Phyllostomus discolor]
MCPLYFVRGHIRSQMSSRCCCNIMPAQVPTPSIATRPSLVDRSGCGALSLHPHSTRDPKPLGAQCLSVHPGEPAVALTPHSSPCCQQQPPLCPALFTGTRCGSSSPVGQLFTWTLSLTAIHLFWGSWALLCVRGFSSSSSP